MNLVIDTGVLGMICHPRKFAEVRLWFRGVIGPKDHKVFLPEIVDFELRRELIRLDSRASLRRLDAMPSETTYLPLDTATMREAAAMWARLWNTGQPLGTADALSADVILAAQARAVGATVITENPGHIGRMVPVCAWQSV